MLVSMVLGVALLQQDADIAKAKWDEVRAVWDGYAGVTIRSDKYRGKRRTATVLQDGRFLIRIEPGTYAIENDIPQVSTVDHFDGERRVLYDVTTNEYVVLADHEAPRWLRSILVLWGKEPLEYPVFDTDLMLITGGYSETYGFTGLALIFTFIAGDVMVLRNRNMTPLTDIRIVLGPEKVDVILFRDGQPIRNKRNGDREVEWSLPPGARFVEKLDIDR